MTHMSLNEQYRFYEQYHRHPLNKLVHIVCIPAIIWSFFILMNARNHHLSLGVYLCYMAYYIKIAPPRVWIPTLACYYLIWWSAQGFTLWVAPTTAWSVGLWVQLGSWVGQILSHKFIEGNRPAFMDGLVQSFLVAPLFVIMEALMYFNLYKLKRSY